MPQASIIIPVYNALEFARKCLASVYGAATRMAFEVIVVDNGSAAPVAAWLAGQQRDHPELRALRFDRPLGFARAVNAGAEQARGDYIVILNSDCAVTDGWLDRLVEVLATHPRVGIVSPVANYSGPGVQLAAQRPDRSPRDPIAEPRTLFFFCVVIRRELWRSLGGLEEKYGMGTYEDDDFCLRARLAGWSLAVAPDVFMWNEASRTFEENRIDREELLFRNETIFLQQASRLSRSLQPAGEKTTIVSTSVLVAVPPGAADRLTGSLVSLANQTVTGFETVIVSPDADEPSIPAELLHRLRIRRIAAEERGPWNAAIAAARGEFAAFLPAGDVYFPYHLEILHRSLATDQCLAAHSAWSVAIHSSAGAARSPAKMFDDQRRLLLAPWAPLVSWMCRRAALSGIRFREDLRSFADWDFTIRLSHRAGPSFATGVTCERNRWAADPRDDARDAEAVMSSFPVAEPWAIEQRLEFLKAVRDGIWEDALIVKRREREYRARRLFRRKTAQPCAIQQARERLAAAPAVREIPARDSGLADFIFLNILRWNDLTQRPHHFAAGLAKRGYRVFWIDVGFLPAADFSGTLMFPKLAENIFEVRLPGAPQDVYHVAWTPALLDLAADALAQLRESAGIKSAIQLINFPGWTPLAKILRSRFAWPIVYDCLDDQLAFGALHGQDAAAYESELTRACDALIASGHTLYEKKAAVRQDAGFIPNAADFDVFHGAAPQGLLDGFPRPVIGFFGALADWLDSDWIAEAARRFPAWSFVFIGSEFFAREEAQRRWRSATSAANVHVLPQTGLPKLAAYLAQFDVCIVPFLDLPITRSMHPVKIYEYLAAGKHILAPALPEMRGFAERGLLVTYHHREESFQMLQMLAAQPPGEEQIAARTAFAAQNDWTGRIERLIQLTARL